MQGLENAIVDHFQNKSLISKIKQVKINRLQAKISINHRLNKGSS